MNYIQYLKKHITLILIIILLSYLSTFFVIEFIVNKANETYEATITSNVIVEEEINAEFFKAGLAKYDKETHELIGYSYATVSFDDIYANDDIEVIKSSNMVTLKIKSKYFISSQGATISSESKTRFENVVNKVAKFYDTNYQLADTIVSGYINGYLFGLIGLGAGLLVSFVVTFILSKNYKKELDICDGNNIFKTPFSVKYWKMAFEKITKMKVFDMCLISVLFALQLVCKFITIPSGFANLGLGITYLVFSLICMIYGPIWGLIIGCLSDVLGFVLVPNGAFYFGYTIQAMLTGFIYGLCLYRTEFNFSKCLIARLLVNLLINAVFGSWLWGEVSELTREGVMNYMLFLSLPKNLIYLIPQSILMYGFIMLVLPVLKIKKIIPTEIVDKAKKNIIA